MMAYLLIFYFLCQAILIAFFVYSHADNDFELTKENITMILCMLAFSPLGMMVLMGVVINDRVQSKIRRECSRITTRWENAARLSTDDDETWDWYTNPAKTELRQNKLRETINCLTDDELETLVTVSKSTFELEKFVREAVMDEIVDRELKKA